jgi:hypothetical protein
MKNYIYTLKLGLWVDCFVELFCNGWHGCTSIKFKNLRIFG